MKDKIHLPLNWRLTRNKVVRTRKQRPLRQEQVGPIKKTKASKTYFDPITLTEGDLYNIGETVRDVTIEAL